MRAIISACGKYRYSLSREVKTAGIGESRRLLFVMLNPSTADSTKDDPTIRKCMGFSSRLYHGGLDVVNLFAYRATNPKELKKVNDPVGPENKGRILKAASESDMIVCAWGTNGTFNRQNEKVMEWLSGYDLYALEITKDGHPKHPLYVSYEKQPIIFRKAQP